MSVFMPTAIQVGPFAFTVDRSPENVLRTRLEARDQRLGETDSRALRIMVDPTLPAMQQRDTLLHEVLHAVWYVVGGYEKDIEEDPAVSRQTSVLLDTMRRNPQLVAYLTGDD